MLRTATRLACGGGDEALQQLPELVVAHAALQHGDDRAGLPLRTIRESQGANGEHPSSRQHTRRIASMLYSEVPDDSSSIPYRIGGSAVYCMYASPCLHCQCAKKYCGPAAVPAARAPRSRRGGPTAALARVGSEAALRRRPPRRSPPAPCSSYSARISAHPIIFPSGLQEAGLRIALDEFIPQCNTHGQPLQEQQRA